jgi:hypothetical protein
MEAAIGPRPVANARVGQKNKITRRWARRGTRPRAPHDQRTMWAARHCPRTNGGPWLAFGAICPEEGKGAGLVMPFCDTAAMQAHLAEISAAVAPGAHAVLILDQAGWRLSKDLVVPHNITPLPLPPRSPELNPVEMSGSSCATTGSRTGSSAVTTTSSPTAARLGMSSWHSPGVSGRSADALGHMGFDQRALV